MNIKSLLLGSAAAFVAVTGARAADAVVIAEPEPMEYVRICDTYGVGFYYIPGTETCLKVSGYIRYDIGVGDLQGFTDVTDKSELLDHLEGDRDYPGYNDTYYKRARFQLRVDSRTETELGTLRTYAAINFNYDTSGVYGVIDVPEHPIVDYGYVTVGDNVGIEHAYIELGGFRVGKTDSLFSTFTGYAGGVMSDDIIGYGPFGTHQIAYTWNGGNGFSAAVALEEGAGSTIAPFGAFFGNPGVTSSGSLYVLDSYVPHIVGGVGYTAGWGGVSLVAGYDSVFDEGAVKGRVDFNATDTLSMFVMAGWASVDDDFLGGIGDSPNYYAPWGGDWAIWGGLTWAAMEKTKFNLQVSYDDWEDFAVVANVQYELVPNFTITPEVSYLDNFDDDYEIDDQWGFKLRMQANFGG